MAKDPAFLFYYQDFLVGTDDFTNEQVGAYIRCLCIQAAKGGITDQHMMKICESYENHEIVKKKFNWDKEDGLFKNERLAKEVEKRKKYCESRSKNKKGTNHMKNISFSYDSHMENENKDIGIIVKPNQNGDKTKFSGNYKAQGEELFAARVARNAKDNGI